MDKKTLIVNICAGPGAGKSLLASGIFYHLKMMRIDCELVTEYAKKVVWEKSIGKLKNQLYIFAKQHKDLFDLIGTVDIIVTDSPIMLGHVYIEDVEKIHGKMDTLKKLIYEEHSKQINMNFFLNRNKDIPYDSNGRNQTLEQSQEKDKQILKILETYNIDYEVIDVSEATAGYVAYKANQKLKQLKNGN